MALQFVTDTEDLVIAMYCDTTDWALGPVFKGPDAPEQLQAFLTWLDDDPRIFTPSQLEARFNVWRAMAEIAGDGEGEPPAAETPPVQTAPPAAGEEPTDALSPAPVDPPPDGAVAYFTATDDLAATWLYDLAEATRLQREHPGHVAWTTQGAHDAQDAEAARAAAQGDPSPPPDQCPACAGSGVEKAPDGSDVTCGLCEGTGRFAPRPDVVRSDG